jgi:hypothetical protein
MDDNKLKSIIQQEISDTVPNMIFDSISTHAHQGGESQTLDGSSALLNTPQPALTTASGGALSTGGGAVLSTGDSAILSNAITRLNDLESKLRLIGLIS